MRKFSLTSINESAAENAEKFISESENSFDKALNDAVEGFPAKSRIVLLAGPSSSGKTTTALKLAQKIRTGGRNAYTVSLDDFYRNCTEIPFGADGLRDFENVTALDLDLIGETFSALIEKGRADLPLFNFKTGSRMTETRHIEMNRDDIIIVEGLHALNPVISQGIDEAQLYKIYISVSSRVLDEKGEILLNKRNLRLARRIIRDYHHRNMSAERTLLQWQSVLNGEDKYLFPYESYADIKIDSFHPYEPCIIRDSLIPLLSTVESDSTVFPKAEELKNAFLRTGEMASSLLPENSLLCEFLR